MNIYYLIVNVIEDNTRKIYRLFISATSYRDAINKVMEQYFDEESQAIEDISVTEFYETDMFVSKSTADRIIEDLNDYPVVEKEDL
jgi:hypothetical protein